MLRLENVGDHIRLSPPDCIPEAVGAQQYKIRVGRKRRVSHSRCRCHPLLLQPQPLGTNQPTNRRQVASTTQPRFAVCQMMSPKIGGGTGGMHMLHQDQEPTTLPCLAHTAHVQMRYRVSTLITTTQILLPAPAFLPFITIMYIHIINMHIINLYIYM